MESLSRLFFRWRNCHRIRPEVLDMPVMPIADVKEPKEPESPKATFSNIDKLGAPEPGSGTDSGTGKF